jgi:hypothetical protein
MKPMILFPTAISLDYRSTAARSRSDIPQSFSQIVHLSGEALGEAGHIP